MYELKLGKEFFCERLIGKGAFSAVYLVTQRGNPSRRIAIKAIRSVALAESPAISKSYQSELRAYKAIPPHPSLITLYAIKSPPRGEYTYLYMEWMPGGDLFSYIQLNRRISEIDAVRLMRQVLEGLAHMHAHGFAHRDLKLENILLDSRVGPPSQCKLCDFGFSTPNSLTSTRCGSLDYAAPEVLRHHEYDPKIADMWSFGIVFYACLHGHLPFDCKRLRMRFPLAPGEPKISPSVSESIANVIKSCLSVFPDKRPTASALLSKWHSLL